MRVSPAIDQYLAGIDDVGDKFYRNVDRVARQIGADDEPDLEFDRIDAHVALDLNGGCREARLVVEDGGPDLLGNIANPGFVNGAVGNVGKTEIEYRLAGVRSIAHVERRLERNGVEQNFEIAGHFPPQHRFGDDLADPQAAAGGGAVACSVADIQLLLCVPGLVSRPEYMHHRRAETCLAADASHGHLALAEQYRLRAPNRGGKRKAA